MNLIIWPLWIWLFIASRFPFDYTAQYNADGVKEEAEYQGIGAVEAFEYEKRKKWIRCSYWEILKTICQTIVKYS